jgi:hypothetical protein
MPNRFKNKAVALKTLDDEHNLAMSNSSNHNFEFQTA